MRVVEEIAGIIRDNERDLSRDDLARIDDLRLTIPISEYVEANDMLSRLLYDVVNHPAYRGELTVDDLPDEAE